MTRILYVCIQSSPHAARWIDCVADAGYDLHMFGHDQHPPNKLLRNVTLHWPVPFEVRPPSEGQPPPVSATGEPLTAAAALDWRVRARRFLRHAAAHPMDALRILRRKLSPPAPIRPAPVASAEPAVPPPPAQEPVEPPVRIVQFKPSVLKEGRFPYWDTGADYDGLNSPEALAEVIREVQPDLIHSMEFQHCAYLVLAARDILGAEGFPPWLATNWGSDIYLFGRDPKHAPAIRRVLDAVDLYSCECHRDIALGREFGYRGPDLPVLPNSGGMDLGRLDPLRSGLQPSRRKQIMVKGYDHFAGRAMVSLDVVERFERELKDYEIVLYSVGARPRARALEMKASGRFDTRVIDFAEHEEIMWNFGRSRVYLGVSISDAISTSVLESMAMGCFPVQTNTSCCEEWFEDGVSGFAVPHDDFATICDRFGRALAEDALVDRAAEINEATIRARLAKEVIEPRVRDFYRQAFEHIGR